MNPQQVRNFAERYFLSQECSIIEKSPAHLQVQLSVEADKDIMNRPFYWMYVERMGLPANPAILTLIFDPEAAPPDLSGELMNFGSPRFALLLESAQKRGRFVRLFESPSTTAPHPLLSRPYVPWLGVNFLVSYVCDRKKDEIVDLGINLHSGEVVRSFYEHLQHKEWSSKLPANRHVIQPHFGIAEGVGELEFHLQKHIEEQDRTWAHEAYEQLEQELDQLDLYYPDHLLLNEETRAEKKQRIREAVWQYHPRVEVSVVNAGLFYLDGGN